MLIGIDEAGMGTLAGPMTAAVVVLADDAQIKGVRDSKKMTSERREEVAAKIMEVAHFYQVGTRDAETVDKIGLSAAWYNLIRELAVAAHLHYPNQEIILDGNRLVGLAYVKPVVKADATHLAVSAASILAKYTQVCWCEDASRLYPEYQFREHHGYPTADHLAALRKFGISPVHRWSYRPTKKAEDWRTVPSYDRYEVSNSGRVRRRVGGRGARIDHVLVSGDSEGYPAVSVYDDRGSHTVRVHQLVAETFLGQIPAPPRNHINHKNGIKSDNRPHNLEYVTPVGNVDHARAMGLLDNRGERNGMSLLNSDDVQLIRELRAEGYTQEAVAEMLGITQPTVSDIERGRRWAHLKE